jgi:hypothetical protein
MVRIPTVRSLLTLTLLAMPVLARADAFDEFRIPDNRTMQWNGNASAGGSWSGDRAYSDHRAADQISGQVDSGLWTQFDSDARHTFMAASVSLTGNRFRQSQGLFAPGAPGFADVERQNAGNVYAAFDQRRYMNDRPWFVGVDAAFSGSFTRTRMSSFTHQDASIAGPEVSAYQYLSDRIGSRSASAWVSAGLGRVRNATGVYDARILEARLLARHVLARPLGAEARKALAALFYAQNDFIMAYDHPEIPVWDRIDAILRADGGLRDSALTAADMVRLVVPYHGPTQRVVLADLLPQPLILRQVGWSAGVVLQGSTMHGWDEASTRTWTVIDPTPIAFTSASRTIGNQDVLQAGVAAEYHRPLSLELQFDASGFLYANIVEHGSGFIEGTALYLGRIVADRWLVTAQLAQNRFLDQTSDGFTNVDRWDVSSQVSVDYYLRDHLSISAAVDQRFTKTRNDVPLLPGVTHWGRSQNGDVRLGLTYRFAGWASLPWADARLSH